MKTLVEDVRRQARLGEFRLLFVSLLFISIALAAVSVLGDRVERGMLAQSGALLGADGLVASSRPIPDEFEQLAEDLGLDSARTVSFLSMAVTPSGSRLARVKVVSGNYPLRGEVITRPFHSDTKSVAGGAPRAGSAWVADDLAREMEAGDDAILGLGRGEFTVDRVILQEPQGGMGAFRIAPRILIALPDLEATGLVTPASRASFRLLVAGPQPSLAAFAEAIETRLASHQSWQAADLGQDELASTAGRVVSYLKLAVLLSVVLAVVAMALAAQGLWRRQIHAGALLRCLGSAHGEAVRRQASIYLLAAMPISAAGVAVGMLIQWLAGAFVESTTGITLPPPGPASALLVWVISVVTVLLVMVPFLLAQRRVPVMVLLRAEQSDRLQAGSIGVLVVVSLIVLFALVLARDLVLAGSVLAGLLVAGALFWGLIRLLLGGVATLIPAGSSSWYMGLKNLVSNARRSAWLASAFGATVFALVLLGAVREDLFEAWSRSVPDDAPNLFMVNIQADEVDPLGRLLKERGIPSERFYPIIRGRLTTIDGERPSEQDFDSERARHRINHEFNLTEDEVLPEGNRIIAGEWFTPGVAGFSVEKETAASLGLDIGTRIAFDVGGHHVEAPVTNIRSVRWDSMKPNFFVLGSPGLFRDAPRSFITAALVDTGADGFMREINREFPAVSIIDLDLILAQVRDLVSQASGAISVIFVFTLGAAMLVLFGVLQGQRGARRREIALLKTLGATHARVRAVVLVEFALLGAVAGLVGSALALASGWLLAVNVFEFDYLPAWRWLVVGAVTSAGVVGVAGYLSIRSLLRVQPVRLLAG